MWLLARQLPVSGEFVLGAMCRRAFTPTVRLWAIRSPFETKEALRTRGHPWMPGMRNGNDFLNGRYALQVIGGEVLLQALAGGDGLQQPVLLGPEEVVGALGQHRAGRDGVDSDPVAAEFAGKRAGHADDRRLRRRVVQAEGHAVDIGEANPCARAIAGHRSFSVVDDDSLTVRTEHPTTILPSILAEWVFPIYRTESNSPIFTGLFAVESFEPSAAIEMTPNTHYAGAEARPDVTLRRIADSQVLAVVFASGEVDMAFNLPVETLSMLETTDGKTIFFPVAYQSMM